MFFRVHRSVKGRKMACIPVFTDQLSHGKLQLFQGILRRFQRVFLHFWEGEFRKTSVRHMVNARKISRIPKFFSHFLDWRFRVNSRKPVLSSGVRGILLVFAFSVGLNIKKKGVFLRFLHSLPHPRSRSFPKFHQ